MTIPIKSLHPDFSIPAFGLGSWMMGGKLEKDNDGVADEKAVREAIDQGITHIDTAELYAAGFAEEIVGNAIAKYDRSKLMIVSKVSSANLHYKNVIESAEKSLLRLKTDYLDLYLVHAANPSIPMKETMDALTEIKRRGMIRNIGVSNFTKERMQEAQSYTKERIVANQVHYNLRYREPELTGLTQYCLENKIILVAWRPIQKGALLEETPPLLNELAQKYSKTVSQIAINWLTSQAGIVTLSTMRTNKHLIENIEAVTWQMEASDIEMLRREYPDQHPFSDAVRLG